MAKNVFDVPSDARQAECFETLLETTSFRVERIVSFGQATPEGERYDQPQDEWVVVVSGRARLRLEDPNELITLERGEMKLISAHRRHRVEWTAPDEATIWLAIHFSADAAAAG